MKAPITNPSWYDIEKACAKIAMEVIRAEGYGSDGIHRTAIVALSRGGLVPGVILSHLLDIPVYPVSYSSKRGRGDDKNHLNALPHLEENILIVDDICDSGWTISEVSAHYRRSTDVMTAALYFKEGGDASFIPDIYVHKIDRDTPWIIFPWES